MDREVDNQKKKEDPTFKGAFHEKKEGNKIVVKPNKSKKWKGT